METWTAHCVFGSLFNLHETSSRCYSSLRWPACTSNRVRRHNNPKWKWKISGAVFFKRHYHDSSAIPQEPKLNKEGDMCVPISSPRAWWYCSEIHLLCETNWGTICNCSDWEWRSWWSRQTLPLHWIWEETRRHSNSESIFWIYAKIWNWNFFFWLQV